MRRVLSRAGALVAPAARARLFSAFPSAQLTALEDAFRRDVEAHLPRDGKGVVFASAWLVSDNVIVALLHKHFPELLRGMGLAAVDTLHLFPETHIVADAVQFKYNKTAAVFKPLGCETKADFLAKFGDAEVLSHDQFDYDSKIEPYKRALEALGREILITGRRADQGAARISLDVWEPSNKALNPLSAWSWDAVLAYVDREGVPYNPAHQYAFRAPAPIPATQRHRSDLPWKRVDLGKPYWQASPEELAGSPPAPVTYVFKSFGDVHSSVPVLPSESERAGRFVRVANTECGIHTRAAAPGVPHGGRLVDLMVTNPAERESVLVSAIASGKVVDLNERQACDVELLINGGFSPLTGFMTKPQYQSVLETMRLPELQLWGTPVVLDVTRTDIAEGDPVLLRYHGQPVAVLHVESAWRPNKVAEAAAILGTTSAEHPAVHELLTEVGTTYLGGRISGLALPQRPARFATPKEVRAALPNPKVAPTVAFQCRNPIHKAHYELIRRVLDDVPGCTVLVHPTCGPTQPGDVEPLQRIHTYEALARELNNPRVQWAYLPFSMRMAGPREAVQHMIVRKNFGCTHFIVGRDMAGTKSTLTDKDFYGPYDAQKMAKAHADELAMTVATYENMVFTDAGYVPETEAAARGLKAHKLSGTQFRRMLRDGSPIPDWFAFKSVIDALRADGREVRAPSHGTIARAS